MNLIDRLAEIYSLPPAEVERWPAAVQSVLYRNARNRGWLIPQETPC